MNNSVCNTMVMTFVQMLFFLRYNDNNENNNNCIKIAPMLATIAVFRVTQPIHAIAVNTMGMRPAIRMPRLASKACLCACFLSCLSMMVIFCAKMSAKKHASHSPMVVPSMMLNVSKGVPSCTCNNSVIFVANRVTRP